MRIQWGLAIAVVATFAWVDMAQAAGPKIDSVRINGASDGAQVSIEGAFDDPQYAVRAKDDGRLIIIDVDGAKLPSSGVQTIGANALSAPGARPPVAGLRFLEPSPLSRPSRAEGYR